LKALSDFYNGCTATDSFGDTVKVRSRPRSVADAPPRLFRRNAHHRDELSTAIDPLRTLNFARV
jgi:hypothetical protein